MPGYVSLFALALLLLAQGAFAQFPEQGQGQGQGWKGHRPHGPRGERFVRQAEPPLEDSILAPWFKDKAEWRRLRLSDFATAFVRRADYELNRPLPDNPPELYLDFSRNGKRKPWETVNGARRGRVGVFAFAEAIECAERFLEAYEETASALCAEPTWVMPAHDPKLDNFNGKLVDIDLGSSQLAADFAVADALIGSRLKPEVRALISENVRKRVLAPFLEMCANKRPRSWWMDSGDNWNAVCLANVCAAGLQFSKTPEERALFISEPSKLIANYLAGFPEDGYCKEGIGYWNYGFGHFLCLSELLRRAAGDKADPLLRPDAGNPALFGFQCGICGGSYISFSDCNPEKDVPDKRLLYIINSRLGLDLRDVEQPPRLDPFAAPLMNVLFASPEPPPEYPPPTPQPQNGLRAWFNAWHVLIARQERGLNGFFGAAFMGGSNDEPHNHNDIGSFIVVKDGVQMLCDPGGEVYTARTFGPKRYDSKALSSYGHSVPAVDGVYQRAGAAAKAVVLESSFARARDFLKLDIKSAYECKSLNSLVRSFVFQRGPAPYVEVEDRVEFSNPSRFEEAFVVYGFFEKVPDGSLLLSYKGVSVCLAPETDLGPYDIQVQRIEENMLGKIKAQRIVFKFKDKVKSGYFKMNVSP